ncbi:MAG: CvpA family protein [bacterium]
MIDLIVLLSFIALFKIGYERGVIAEITDIVAIVIALIVAYTFTDSFSSFLGTIINIQNKNFLKVITGIVLFLITGFITMAIGYGIELYSKGSEILSMTNKLLGGIVALIKVYIFWWSIFFIISLFPSKNNFQEYIASSYSYKIIYQSNSYLLELLKKENK